MLTVTNASATVIVVDRLPEDYHRLARFARQAGMRFFHLRSALDALQIEPQAVSLWIVNIDLQDLSGFELVERLRPRWRDSDVFLVADHYRAEDERRVLTSGVTMYLCKPARAAWLSDWRPRTARAAGGQPTERRREPSRARATTG